MASKTSLTRTPRADVPERRISAFIYGNILVLSVLLVLAPDALRTTSGIISVLGVGVSTYVAHVVSDLFAHLLRHPDGAGLSARLTDDLRDALPIATSALLPTTVLLAAWLGWLAPELAWTLAIGGMLVRLSLLGPIAAWIAREPFSLWPFLAGVLAAVLIAGIALLKALLIH